MTTADLDAIIADLRRQGYGPLITAREAAAIANRRVQTIYDWSSRGDLDAFKSTRGGVLLLTLDGFVRYLFKDDDDV